jgi:hypothetical protein
VFHAVEFSTFSGIYTSTKIRMNTTHFRGAEIIKKFQIGPKMGAQAMHC